MGGATVRRSPAAVSVPTDLPSLRRRLPLLAVAALVAAVAMLALVAGGRAASGGDEARPRFADASCTRTAVRLGFALPDGDEAGPRAAERAARSFGELLACPVQVVVRRDQVELVAALALHQIDLAQLDPLAMVVGDRVAAIAPIGAYATGLDVPARGAPSRIWTRGTRIDVLSGLRGRRLALGPALTAGGDLLPRRALLDVGLRAGEDVPTVRAADDARALALLRRGAVDAAVTRGPLRPEDERGLREVWRSEPVLADVVAIRPGVPGALRRLIGASVRGLTAVSIGALADRQGIARPTGMVNVPPDLYGPLADGLDHLTGAGLSP